MSRLVLSLLVLSLLACSKTSPGAAAPEQEPAPVISSAVPSVGPPVAAADPTAHFALRVSARAAYKAGDWLTCERDYLRSAALTPWRQAVSHDYYNAACCAAQRGAAPAAFEILSKSVDAGFANAWHLDNDRDLLSLHGEPEWAPIMARVQVLTEERNARNNGRFWGIYLEEQEDRGLEQGPEVYARDVARRAEIEQLLAASDATSAEDLYYAALIFLHSSTREDIQRAYELAQRSIERDPHNARSLFVSAAAFDRRARLMGEPQRYGTELVFDEETGSWSLYDLDPAVTDEERAALNVQPLAMTRADVASMNAAQAPE
jgi:hypothetical protein